MRQWKYLCVYFVKLICELIKSSVKNVLFVDSCRSKHGTGSGDCVLTSTLRLVRKQSRWVKKRKGQVLAVLAAAAVTCRACYKSTRPSPPLAGQMTKTSFYTASLVFVP